MLEGLFDQRNFLDILQNFTVFEPMDGRIIKKIPRYQQFRAVQRRLNDSSRARRQEARRSHLAYAGLRQVADHGVLEHKDQEDPKLRDHKLVFLTDRTQLDGQLTSTFENAQGETVHNASSVANLKELLAKDSSDIVTPWCRSFRRTRMNSSSPSSMSRAKSLCWPMRLIALSTGL